MYGAIECKGCTRLGIAAQEKGGACYLPCSVCQYSSNCLTASRVCSASLLALKQFPNCHASWSKGVLCQEIFLTLPFPKMTKYCSWSAGCQRSRASSGCGSCLSMILPTPYGHIPSRGYVVPHSERD